MFEIFGILMRYTGSEDASASDEARGEEEGTLEELSMTLRIDEEHRRPLIVVQIKCCLFLH